MEEPQYRGESGHEGVGTVVIDVFRDYLREYEEYRRYQDSCIKLCGVGGCGGGQ